MRLQRCLAVLLVVVAFAATSLRAVAHPLGNFTINHLSRITLAGDALTLRYVVDFAEIPAFAEQRAVDPSGVMTSAERARWAAAQARTLTASLHVAADGTPIALTGGTATALARPGAGGLSTLYLTVVYHATVPHGTTTFTYRDEAFANRTGWRDVVLANEHEPTDALRSYPSALIGSPPDRTVAAFTRRGDGALVRADAAQPAPPAAQAGSTSLARSNDLSDMLVRNDASVGFFLALFGLAIFLGAMHAIEPGHGKTLMAVSLVGARATVAQAAILASAITVAHTAGVIALGVVILFAAKYVVPEQIYPWITLGSGVVVAILAARALARFVEARRPRLHAHAHAHPAAREHVHEHVHGLGASDHHAPHDHDRHDPAEFDPAAAARAAFAAHGHDHGAMSAEEHARAHAIPGSAPLGFGSVVAAAMTGGIAPCPAALVVLLTAVNVHKIGLGLLLIVAFSFGLAAVLVGIGIAVVRGASLLARSSRFKLFTQYGPLFSAGIIALIGAGMIGEGLVAQGVGGTPLLFAALALLAIVGYAFGSHTHAHAPRAVA